MIHKFGEFELDDQLFRLRCDGVVVPLERRVFDLLAYLILQRHRVVTKAELFECLWEGRKVSEGSLTVAVAAARKALGDNPNSPGMIETHHGRGYRFSADVVEIRSAAFAGSYSPRVHREARGFVGREDELALLRACFEASAEGRRQVCLLSGEPGIGKSRLADEFAQLAAKLHAKVLTARCLEADGAPPFWPWTQILRELLRRNALRHDISSSVRGELGRLVPELATMALSSGDREQNPTRARFRLFDAVSYVIREAAIESPIVLVIDDIHRADKPSLLLLEFIIKQLRESRLLIVMTDRDTETQRSALHSEALGAIFREDGARVALLSGLTRGQIAEFIHSAGAASGDTAEAQLLHELTGGNPFFLTQLLPLLGELTGKGDRVTVPIRSLPGTVRDAIAKQLDGLGDATVEILRVASVIGRDFSEQLLRLATRQVAGTADAIEESCNARVVIRHPSGEGVFRFSHALVRDALYDRLPPKIRSALHWRVGEALQKIAGDNSEGQLLEIAHHFYRGVGQENGLRALETCAAAGALASKRLAYEEAVVQYGRATELASLYRDRDHGLLCELHLALGAEQARAGDRGASQATFGVASNLARRLDDGVRFAGAALGAFPGFFAVEAGAPDAFAIALLREALDRIGDTNPHLRALLLARLAMAVAWSDEGTNRITMSREAARLATTSGDPALILQVLLARWFAEWEPGGFEERWDIAEELMERASLSGDRETLLLCRLFWVTCLLERGEMAEFLRQVTVFEEAAEVLRQREALWYAALLRSVHALHEGRLADAEALSLRFAEIGELIGDANVFHCRMAHKIILGWETGKTEELITAALQGCEAYPGVVGWRAAYTWSLGQAGRLDECRREFEALARRGFQHIPRRMDWGVTMAFLADVAALLGAEKEAGAIYRLLEPLRGRSLVLGLCVANWGCASRYLGSLARTMGRDSEAAELFLEAINVDDHAGARAWAARDRYEYARLCQHSADRQVSERAASMLREAEQSSAELGLSNLALRLDGLRCERG
jgi:DNA-binding winged helix-turn-helix (wHTH) protein/tetratricopeptide (TPR) repeat protein